MSEEPNTPLENTPPSPETPNPEPASSSPPPPAAAPAANQNQWLMFMHLSQLANLIAPVIGIAAPIIIWQIKKNEFPEMDRHGKMVANFCIVVGSLVLINIALSIVTCGFLMPVTVPLMLLVSVAWAVFAIIGGIKANDGVFWRYPGTINFIK